MLLGENFQVYNPIHSFSRDILTVNVVCLDRWDDVDDGFGFAVADPWSSSLSIALLICVSFVTFFGVEMIVVVGLDCMVDEFERFGVWFLILIHEFKTLCTCTISQTSAGQNWSLGTLLRYKCTAKQSCTISLRAAVQHYKVLHFNF